MNQRGEKIQLTAKGEKREGRGSPLQDLCPVCLAGKGGAASCFLISEKKKENAKKKSPERGGGTTCCPRSCPDQGGQKGCIFRGKKRGEGGIQSVTGGGRKKETTSMAVLSWRYLISRKKRANFKPYLLVREKRE